MALCLPVIALVVATFVFLNKVSGKLGISALLLFLVLGLLVGSPDRQFAAQEGWLVGDISTIALIFIMFYGGFGTRWKSARPVVVEAGLLATVGVALTSAFVGFFCHFALSWGWIESFLMGAVISSTDAATVFSILRTRKLGLKNNTAPLIEVESGSNDPMSYMLTAVMLSMMPVGAVAAGAVAEAGTAAVGAAAGAAAAGAAGAVAGTVSAGHIVWTIFSQLVFGAGCGLLIATCAVWMIRRIAFKNNGFDILLFIAVAIIAYALPNLIGGNGYLSAYIVGIVLGNTDFAGRKTMVAFFDAITSLMQIMIFFLLGMLANPSDLVGSLLPAVLIFAFLTLIARPLAVCGVLAPFRKYPANQLGLISFVGLRGAASIVFAIMILTSGAALQNDIFSIVFCTVIISILFQGSLVPWFARKSKMIDEGADVMTTFSDFGEDADITLGTVAVTSGSSWDGRMIRDLGLPPECLITMVLRAPAGAAAEAGQGSGTAEKIVRGTEKALRSVEKIVPKGDTRLQAGDEVVVCTRSYQGETAEAVIKHPLSATSKWAGHMAKEYPRTDNGLLVLIQRGDQNIIPNGDTILHHGDVLVILKRD